jgi:hypothetical protein
MRRHGVVNDHPTAVRKEHQTIEQLKVDHRHAEQVRGGNPCCMVAQEGRPALTRSSRALDHVLGNCRLGDLDAELEQLSVDPGRAPQPVGAVPGLIDESVPGKAAMVENIAV